MGFLTRLFVFLYVLKLVVCRKNWVWSGVPAPARGTRTLLFCIENDHRDLFQLSWHLAQQNSVFKNELFSLFVLKLVICRKKCGLKWCPCTGSRGTRTLTFCRESDDRDLFRRRPGWDKHVFAILVHCLDMNFPPCCDSAIPIVLTSNISLQEFGHEPLNVLKAVVDIIYG